MVKIFQMEKVVLIKKVPKLFNIGVNVITGGNHTWDKHQSQDYLKN